jgi:hypothetical protein
VARGDTVVIKPWHLAVIAGAFAVWYFFIRQPALRPPAGSALPSSGGGGGLVGQLTQGIDQGKALWGKIFGGAPPPNVPPPSTANFESNGQNTYTAWV